MGATVADLEAFIATLRSDREQRSGPGVYASDKVFALLDELDRLRSIELYWQIDTLGGVIDAASVQSPADALSRHMSIDQEMAWVRRAQSLLETSMVATGHSTMAQSDAFWDLQLMLARRLMNLGTLRGNPAYTVDLYEDLAGKEGA